MIARPHLQTEQAGTRTGMIRSFVEQLTFDESLDGGAKGAGLRRSSALVIEQEHLLEAKSQAEMPPQLILAVAFCCPNSVA